MHAARSFLPLLPRVGLDCRFLVCLDGLRRQSCGRSSLMHAARSLFLVLFRLLAVFFFLFQVFLLFLVNNVIVCADC